MWGCAYAPFAGFGGGFGILLCLLLLSLLLLMAIKVSRVSAPMGGSKADSAPPMEILKNRLANGEITIDEFNALKQLLR
jgi:putative membrane protein